MGVRFLPEHEFIEHLSMQVQNGLGLVPFIGSGCSSNSGILMGTQFTDYLAWTVFLCVASPRRRSQERIAPGRRWDLRKNGWPPLPSYAQTQAARKWALEEFQRVGKDCGLEIDYDRQKNLVRRVTRAGGNNGSPGSLAELLHAPLVPPFLRDPAMWHSNLKEDHSLRQLHTLLRGPGLVQGGFVRSSVSPTSEAAIVERAIRSLYDWRATLHFLAELELSPDPDDEQPLSLRKADRTIIDSFNVHITRGRRPNMIHIMLGHLRRPARMRLILTTNFDTLIEDAFTEQHQRIDAISVSIEGSLPDPEIVHSRDTVVKLHGSLSETRADFSLDDLPSLSDRKRFFSYVRGGRPNEKRGRDGRFIPSQLLVMGYSGSDARCVQLMKFVLDSDPAATIFWVCHNERDRSRLSALFPENDYTDRLVATTVDRTDLMLLELYQRLCLCLPPAGSVYQLNHNVPPARSFRPQDQEDERRMSPTAQEIVRHFSDAFDPAGDSTEQKPVLLVLDGTAGLMRPMQIAFDHLARQYEQQKVWLELEDFGGTASVAHGLFQVIALQRGQLQLNHAQLSPHRLGGKLEPACDARVARERYAERVQAWKEHIHQLTDYLNIEPRRWLIALYGRNGAGGCCGWDENQFWPATEYGDQKLQPSMFGALLHALVLSGFSVIYAPYTRIRRVYDERGKEAVKLVLKEYRRELAHPNLDEIVNAHFKVPAATDSVEQIVHWVRSESANGCQVVPVDLSAHLPPPDETFTDIMRAALRMGLNVEDGPPSGGDPHTLEEVSSRYSVIYASTLFRQSRHYSAFLSEAVFSCPARFNAHGFDNDLLRHRQLQKWLVKFNRFPRVFLRKPGGFAWMYWDVRMGLRSIAEAVSGLSRGNATIDSSAMQPGARALRPCAQFRARTHFNVGDWYLRAYRTSGYAGALLEAVYHFYQAVKHAPKAALPAGRDRAASASDATAAEVASHQLAVWRLAMNHLVQGLRLGVPALRFWLGPDQAAVYFSQTARGAVTTTAKANLDEIRRKLEHNGSTRDEDVLCQLLECELEQLEALARDTSSDHTPRIQHDLSLHGARGSSERVEAKRTPTMSDLNDAWWEQWEGTHPGPNLPIPELVETIFAGSRNKDIDREDLVDRRRILKEQRCILRSDSERHMQELLEWAVVVVRRAEREERAHAVEEWSHADGKQVGAKYPRICLPARTRVQWVRACALARCGLDAGNWVFAGLEPFVARQSVKALALYGLSLAHLHRFHEAHRRFNDAQSLLAERFAKSDVMLQSGILELRRAEAYLLEASLARELSSMLDDKSWTGANPWTTCKIEGIDCAPLSGGERTPPASTEEEAAGSQDDAEHESNRPKRRLLTWFHDPHPKNEQLTVRLRSALWVWLEPSLEAFNRDRRTRRGTLGSAFERMVAARIDDAWACLERAEWLLGGRTASPRWWAQLRTLQLWALASTEARIQRDSEGALVVPRRKATIYRPLCDRVRHDVPSQLRTLWKQGLAAAPDDAYSALRLIDHLLTALGTGDTPDVKAVRQEAIEKLASLTARFREPNGVQTDARVTVDGLAYRYAVGLANRVKKQADAGGPRKRTRGETEATDSPRGH